MSRTAQAVDQAIKLITETEARAEGFVIVKGAYKGARNNVAGTWYVDRVTDHTLNRSGRGCTTRREALAYITEVVRLRNLPSDPADYNDDGV